MLISSGIGKTFNFKRSNTQSDNADIEQRVCIYDVRLYLGVSHHLITSCAHASLKPCVAVKLFYFQRIDKISYTDEFSLQSSLI